MLKEGLEPSRSKEQRILSPLCLPIPPFEQKRERSPIPRSQFYLAPNCGGNSSQKSTLDRIRTCDHPLRRRMLYPAELRVQKTYSITPIIIVGNNATKAIPSNSFLVGSEKFVVPAFGKNQHTKSIRYVIINVKTISITITSFGKRKWTHKDLNLGPADYESDALTN